MSTTTTNTVESIVANAPLGVLVIRDGRIARYNHKFSDMFGIAGSEGLGLLASTLLSSRNGEEAFNELADALIFHGKSLRSEVCLQRGDGTVFSAEVMGYSVDPDKHDGEIVWIVDDRVEFSNKAENIAAVREVAAIAIGTTDPSHALRRDGKLGALPARASSMNGRREMNISAENPLFSVPGLNADLGLRRSGGRMSLYVNQLRMFLYSYKSVFLNIGVALGAANFQLAARLAHALKGSASNIGATPLAKLAAEVDDAIRQHGNGKRTKLSLIRLDAALDEFLDALTVALNMTDVDSVDDSLAVLPEQIIEQVAARLLQREGDAAHYFEANAGILRRLLSVAVFESFAEAVRQKDFALIMALLGEMRRSNAGGAG